MLAGQQVTTSKDRRSRNTRASNLLTARPTLCRHSRCTGDLMIHRLRRRHRARRMCMPRVTICLPFLGKHSTDTNILAHRDRALDQARARQDSRPLRPPHRDQPLCHSPRPITHPWHRMPSHSNANTRDIHLRWLHYYTLASWQPVRPTLMMLAIQSSHEAVQGNHVS